MANKLRKKLAAILGYDLVKKKKQMTLDGHLSYLVAQLGIDIVVDVGANEGQYGALLRGMGYKGEIVSFEPLPKAFEVLSHRCAKDSRWSCYDYALSDTSNKMQLNVARNSVFSSFHAPNERSEKQYWPRAEIVDTLEIDCKRLDDVLPDVMPGFPARRVLLKMDTQGHDEQVLRGAMNSIQYVTALHSELSVAGIYEDVPDYIQALSWYRELGFELTGIYSSGRDSDTGHIVELDCVMARA